MSDGKVMRFSKVEWIDNIQSAISPPPSPSTFCASPSPPQNLSSQSLSPPPNSHKRQRMDWDWDFLTPQMFPSSPTMSPSPQRDIEDETDNYRIALRSTIYPTKDISLVTPNHANKTAALQPNARLTRNQAHQQGIVLPPTSSYFAYTNTLPLFSLLSAAVSLDPIEPQNYKEAVIFNNPDRAQWIKAMSDEMSSLLHNETWKLMEPPPTVRTLGAK